MNRIWLTTPMTSQRRLHNIILFTLFIISFRQSYSFQNHPAASVCKNKNENNLKNELQSKRRNFPLSSVRGRLDLLPKLHGEINSRKLTVSSLASNDQFYSFRKKSIFRNLRRKRKKNYQADNLSTGSGYQLPGNKTDFRRRFLESYKQSTAMHRAILKNESNPIDLTSYPPKNVDSITLRQQVKESNRFDGSNNYIGYWNREGKRKDKSILSYVPFHVLSGIIPPKTEELLVNITWQYINMEGAAPSGTEDNTENDSQTPTPSSTFVSIKNVMDVFDEEYYYLDVPFVVGKIVYESGKFKRDELERNSYIFLSKLFSFAAMYRLPSEVVTLMLDNCARESNFDTIDIDVVQNIRDQYQPKNMNSSNGWNAVSFPQGLSVRIHRRFLEPEGRRFTPIRRLNRLVELFPSRKNRNQVSVALIAITEASTVRPPRKMIRWKNIDILHKLDANLKEVIRKTSSDYDSYWQAILKNQFFPKRRFKKIQRRWRSIIRGVKKNQQSILTLCLMALLSFSAYIIRKLFIVHQNISKVHSIPVS